jgi:hypothetical protein
MFFDITNFLYITDSFAYQFFFSLASKKIVRANRHLFLAKKKKKVPSKKKKKIIFSFIFTNNSNS